MLVLRLITKIVAVIKDNFVFYAIYTSYITLGANSVLNLLLENGRKLQKSCFQPSPLKVNSNHPVKEQCSPKLLLSARKDKFFKSKLI